MTPWLASIFLRLLRNTVCWPDNSGEKSTAGEEGSGGILRWKAKSNVIFSFRLLWGVKPWLSPVKLLHLQQNLQNILSARLCYKLFFKKDYIKRLIILQWDISAKILTQCDAGNAIHTSFQQQGKCWITFIPSSFNNSLIHSATMRVLVTNTINLSGVNST